MVELLDSNAAIGLLTERLRAVAARAAGERAPARPAPGRDGAAHRQPRASGAAHLLTQLQHRAQALGDQRLRDLRDELLGYPGGMAEAASPAGVVLPLRYRRGGQELALFSVFSAAVGTATDVTVEELAIEAFYPADAATAKILRSLHS